VFADLLGKFRKIDPESANKSFRTSSNRQAIGKRESAVWTSDFGSVEPEQTLAERHGEKPKIRLV
jgi:hypothetical protein